MLPAAWPCSVLQGMLATQSEWLDSLLSLQLMQYLRGIFAMDGLVPFVVQCDEIQNVEFSMKSQPLNEHLRCNS